jgi:hypothetical protein
MRENKALPMTPGRIARLAAALFAVLALAAGCGPASDPVRQTIDGIVEGAQERDARAIVERLSPDFQAADGSGRSDAEVTLSRYLAAYEKLGVRISDLKVERAAGAARARFRADLSGSPRRIGGLDGLLPRSSAYRFDLRLVPTEGGRWLVTWASWEPAS